MRTGFWVVAGWFGTAFCTALACRLAPAHVFPDISVIVVCFVALHHKPVATVTAALALGYLAGRQGMAPIGLHEGALGCCALGVYVVSGKLAGSGTAFFTVVCAVCSLAYHLLLFLALRFGPGSAGFSSWATAALVFNALATAVLALACYRPMAWIEQRISAQPKTGLEWR